MTIYVNLHHLPYFNFGHKKAIVSVPSGATAVALLHEMDIPCGDIGVIASGGAHLSPDDALSDGMTVDLYPIVAGG